MDDSKMGRTEGAIVEDGDDGVPSSPWSVVIRPQTLTLADLESRILGDLDFARAVASHPAFARSLASALVARDAESRARWQDAGELARHLSQFAADAAATSLT